MAIRTTLKPCPFCGKTPVIEDCGMNTWFIRCKCGIAQERLYHQRCDAVKAWNKRSFEFDEWVQIPLFIGKRFPNVLDPEWQKVHMEMGFYSPIGELYKELGVYDDSAKGEKGGSGKDEAGIWLVDDEVK